MKKLFALLARLEKKADRLLALLEDGPFAPGAGREEPPAGEKPGAPADIFSEWMLGSN